MAKSRPAGKSDADKAKNKTGNDSEHNMKPKDLFFNDGERRIDFILAWSKEDGNSSKVASKARAVFEKNLREEGLQLEYTVSLGHTGYVKVHAPYQVLRRYADIIKLRLPIKAARSAESRKIGASDMLVKLKHKILRPFQYDRKKLPSLPRPLTCPYSSSKEYLFDIPDNPENVFSNATRSWIVDYILRRKYFADTMESSFACGINKMISDGFYTAAYPLHEGDWRGSVDNPRKILFDCWASWDNCFKLQPINHIRVYFGETIALYFAWLGFYTSMLIPAAVVGVAVFVVSIFAMLTDTTSQELCDSSHNITMCPLCDIQCGYWKLDSACMHAIISRMFDNWSTVFFAIFMSLWGTFFLEFWKREQATIQYRWDLTTFVEEEQPPRPEYLSKLENWQNMKVNPVTGMKEPYLPFWRKQFPRYFTSYSIMLLMIYGRLAFLLTDWEYLRTQSEYDSSITLKLFVFQFINCFSSIYYIAFFKGQFVGRPGKYRTVFGSRLEECNPAGCLIELCIQLAIIMVGQQLIQNNLMEVMLPKIIHFIKLKLRASREEQKPTVEPWEKDYLLESAREMSLFYEYLEMVMQFGFLTIFCAAFPLGPLFSLMNNIMEIRVDASKFVTQLQRPVADKSASIGVWYSVLYIISRIAIITNAMIIALTSEFIPRLVYTARYSQDGSLTGYTNFTLSYFNTSDFTPDHRQKHLDEEICRYKDFRNPPWAEEPYDVSSAYWHVLAARLAFICVFENIVVVVTSLLSWLIPDIPSDLREQIRRETYVTNEIVLATELKRARGETVTEKVLLSVTDLESTRYWSTDMESTADALA
ncbi:hypothetical protein BsWGS_27984 [Bradybaena similaris]